MSYPHSRWIRIQNAELMELHATLQNRDELDLLLFELRTLRQFLPAGDDEAERLVLANAPFPTVFECR